MAYFPTGWVFASVPPCSPNSDSRHPAITPNLGLGPIHCSLRPLVGPAWGQQGTLPPSISTWSWELCHLPPWPGLARVLSLWVLVLAVQCGGEGFLGSDAFLPCPPDSPSAPVNVTVRHLKANSAVVSWDVLEDEVVIGFAISQQVINCAGTPKGGRHTEVVGWRAGGGQEPGMQAAGCRSGPQEGVIERG